MNQPKSLIYETPYKTVEIKDLSGIKKVNGVEVLDGGTIKHNGKVVSFYVQIGNRPELAKQVEIWRSEWEAYKAHKAAEFAVNVLGLEELRDAKDKAQNDFYRYGEQLNAMMEDECNDGAFPPAPINETLHRSASDLAKEYPRAAIYLKAEGYACSNNMDKYSAGKKAMEIISTGGSIKEAEDVLENWLPEEKFWD